MQNLAEASKIFDEDREDSLVRRERAQRAKGAVVPVNPCGSRNEIGEKTGNISGLIFKADDVFAVGSGDGANDRGTQAVQCGGHRPQWPAMIQAE